METEVNQLSKVPKIGQEMKREKRYVQCISAHIDLMIGILLRQVGCFFFDSVKTSPSSANIKTLKLYWKFVFFY